MSFWWSSVFIGGRRAKDADGVSEELEVGAFLYSLAASPSPPDAPTLLCFLYQHQEQLAA